MACIACAKAGVVPVVNTVDAEYDPHPQYSYGYDVQDQLTGDSKNHQETRDGDVVRGQYSLLEADGTRRIVDYTADPINGFNAIVRKEGLVAPAVAPAAPVVAAAPVYETVSNELPTVIDARSAPLVASRSFAPAPYFAPAPQLAAYSAARPFAYNAAPVAYTNGAPLAYTNGAPLAYTNGAPIAYTNGAHFGYSAASPFGYSPYASYSNVPRFSPYSAFY